MKRISLFFLAVMAILPMMADNNPRIVESLNFDWRFHAGDVDGAQTRF